MASLSFSEKTRIGSILRRVMLDGLDHEEVQMARNTEHSSLANPAQAPLGIGPDPAPPLGHHSRLVV